MTTVIITSQGEHLPMLQALESRGWHNTDTYFDRNSLVARALTNHPGEIGWALDPATREFTITSCPRKGIPYLDFLRQHLTSCNDG